MDAVAQDVLIALSDPLLKGVFFFMLDRIQVLE